MAHVFLPNSFKVFLSLRNMGPIKTFECSNNNSRIEYISLWRHGSMANMLQLVGC